MQASYPTNMNTFLNAFGTDYFDCGCRARRKGRYHGFDPPYPSKRPCLLVSGPQASALSGLASTHSCSTHSCTPCTAGRSCNCAQPGGTRPRPRRWSPSQASEPKLMNWARHLHPIQAKKRPQRFMKNALDTMPANPKTLSPKHALRLQIRKTLSANDFRPRLPKPIFHHKAKIMHGLVP